MKSFRSDEGKIKKVHVPNKNAIGSKGRSCGRKISPIKKAVLLIKPA